MHRSVLRADDMRRENRRRILRDVRHAGSAAQGDIAARTGLSAATVSSIAGELLECGALLRETQNSDLRTARGRPRLSVSLNGEAARAGVIIVQAERIVSAVCRFDGTIVSRGHTHLPVPDLAPDELVDAVLDHLGGHAGDLSESGIRHITMGFQGITDRQERRLLWSPVTAFSDAGLADLVEEKSGISASIRNDSDMVTLALLNDDRHTLGSDFCMILLSQGVGMGLVLGGRIVNGIQSSATEFGHMVYAAGGDRCRCGRRGCIEAYAGGYAIQRRATGRPDGPVTDSPVMQADIEAIARAAAEGDSDARAAATAAGHALGVGLANIFCLFDPVPVALVGRGTHLMHHMEPAMRKALADHASADLADTISFDVHTEALPLLISGCSRDALDRIDERFAAFEALQPDRLETRETV